MTDTLYVECLEILENIHADMPDLRFGEVLQNAVDCALATKNGSLCNVSTKQLKTALQNYYNREKSKRGI